MDAAELVARARLNEYELWREMLRHSGGTIVERNGLLLLLGPSRHLRVMMRTDERLPPGEALERAKRFFKDGGAYTVVVREPLDSELVPLLVEAGFRADWEERLMGATARVGPVDLPAGAELRPVRTLEQVREFSGVVAEANDHAERERAGRVFARPESLIAPHVRAFLAYLDGEPVSGAMTLMSHGIAGIFWVATVERARRRGLGAAVTCAAAGAGFGLDARAAWLGASPMGMGLYHGLGFRELGGAYVEYESPD